MSTLTRRLKNGGSKNGCFKMARLGEIPATAVTSSVRVDELSSEFKWTVYSRHTVFTIDRRTAVLNTKLRTEILSAGELEVNVHAVC